MKSQHRFTGVVVATADEGRAATVRTDNNGTVKVSGAEEPGAITSVDRTFKTGMRYEFHPLNGASPYRDNACTATRELGPAAVPQAGGQDGGQDGGKDAGRGLPDGPTGWLLLAASGLVAVALCATLVRRSLRQRPAD